MATSSGSCDVPKQQKRAERSCQKAPRSISSETHGHCLVPEREVSVTHEILLVSTQAGSRTAHQRSQLRDSSIRAEPDLPAVPGVQSPAAALSSPSTTQLGNTGCCGDLKHPFCPPNPRLQNPHASHATERAHDSHCLKTVFLHQKAVFYRIPKCPKRTGKAPSGRAGGTSCMDKAADVPYSCASPQ